MELTVSALRRSEDGLQSLVLLLILACFSCASPGLLVPPSIDIDIPLVEDSTTDAESVQDNNSWGIEDIITTTEEPGKATSDTTNGSMSVAHAVRNLSTAVAIAILMASFLS